MRDDPRFDLPGDIPFGPARLIMGGFAPLHVSGRDGDATPAG